MLSSDMARLSPGRRWRECPGGFGVPENQGGVPGIEDMVNTNPNARGRDGRD